VACVAATFFLPRGRVARCCAREAGNRDGRCASLSHEAVDTAAAGHAAGGARSQQGSTDGASSARVPRCPRTRARPAAARARARDRARADQSDMDDEGGAAASQAQRALN